MQVLHHEHQGLLLCGVQEQMPQQGKGPGLSPLRTAPRQGLWSHREVQELE